MAKKKTQPVPPQFRYQPGALSMAQLLDREKYLYTAATDAQIIQAHARFMFASEVKGYQDWAKTNPSLDVRTYGPLVDYVSPFEKDGQAIAFGDIETQAADGTLGASTTTRNPSTLFASSTSGIDWSKAVPQPSGNGTPIAATPEDSSLLGNVVGGIGDFLGSAGSAVKDFVEGASRAVVIGGSTPYDYAQAGARTYFGQQAQQDSLKQKYGLTDAELSYVVRGPEQSPEAVAAGVAGQAPGAAGGAALMAHETQQAYDAADAERKAVLDKARAEWQGSMFADSGKVLDSMFKSTLLGQTVENPDLAFGSGPEATGFLPSTKLNEAADTNSAKVYDIVTPEERARLARQIQTDVLSQDHVTLSFDQALALVRPMGWTPGRGLAHQVWDVDETAFNTVSGLVDMTTNVVGDPLNLIPVAKGGTLATSALAKIPGTTAHALTLGDKAIVASKVGTAFAKGGGPGVTYSTKGVSRALRGKDAVANAEIAAGKDLERLYDPSIPDHIVDPDTGLVRGPHTQTVVSENAWNWLNGAKGQRAVSLLTNLTSPTEIMLRSNRKMDADLALDLANSTTETQTRLILATRMGIDITKPSEFGSIARRPMPSIFRPGPLVDSMFRQQFRLAPRSNAHIDLNRTEDAVYQLESWARGLGVPLDSIKGHLDEFIRSSDDIDRYSTIYGRSGDVAKGVEPKEGLITVVNRHLLGDTSGMTKKQADMRERVARWLTTAFEGGLNPAQRNWANAGLDGAFGSAEGDLGRVLLEHESLSRTAILPDYRTIKRYQGFIGKTLRLMDTAPDSEKANVARILFDGLQGLTTEWRNLVLVRPAYTLREMIDLSVATSLAGYSSPLTHPVAFMSHALAAAVAKDSSSLGGRLAASLARKPDAVAHLPQIREYLAHTQGVAALAPGLLTSEARVNGEAMWDAWNRFIASGETDFSHYDEMFDGLAGYHGNFNIDQGRARAAERYMEPVDVNRVDQRGLYAEALAQRIAHVARDRDMAALASPTATMDDVLNGFRNGSRARKMKQRPDLLNDADPNLDIAYLHGYRDILRRITNDRPDLLEAVASGTFDGAPLLKTKVSRNGKRANDALVARITELLDDEGFRNAMPKQMWVPKRYAVGDGIRQKWDALSDGFFASTGDITDMMVRAPMLREAYVQGVERIGKWMSPAAKAAVVANLRAAGDIKLARRVQKIAATGHLDVAEVERVASTHARRESQRIFYDATRRQNYAYAGRVLMPFLQATVNTFRRWGQFALQNPQLGYRTIKPLYYLEQPGSAVIYDAIAKATGDPGIDAYYTPGRPDQSVDGFFYEDEFGDRRFAYPMLSPVAAALGMGLPGGIPDGVTLTGTMGGLNVAGQTINPGVGPVATFAAALLAEDLVTRKGTLGDFGRAMFPYDLPEGDLKDKVWGSFMPTLYQKINTASGDDRLIANMSMKMMPALIDTGRYDLSTEAGKRLLVYDAQALASRLYLITAIGGALSPTQMTPTALAKVGPSNAQHLMLVSEISKEFRKYQDRTPDYFTAVEDFVRDYGETALFSILPRTSTDGPQATNDVWAFRDQAPEAYRSHYSVIGYFFAAGDGTFDDPTNPRSYSAPLARAQRMAGERTYKTPEEFVDGAQDQVAWMLWNAKTTEIAKRGYDDTTTANLRREVKAAIQEKYPHWTGQAKDPGAVATDIRDLTEALQDDSVQSLASAKYLGAYLQRREQVLGVLAKNGVHSLTSKAAEGANKALTRFAYQMMALDGTGAFTRTYNTLLSRELEA